MTTSWRWTRRRRTDDDDERGGGSTDDDENGDDRPPLSDERKDPPPTPPLFSSASKKPIEDPSQLVGAVVDELSGQLPLTKAKDGPNDYLSDASLWSKLVFGWFEPLLELGRSQGKLNPEDVATHLPLPKDCVTEHVMREFDRRWKEEKERVKKREKKEGEADEVTVGGDGSFVDNVRGKSDDEDHHNYDYDKEGEGEGVGEGGPPPSLIRPLFYAFGLDFLKAGLLKLVADLAVFVGPQVLKGFIAFVSDANAPIGLGLSLTAAVTASQLVMSLCTQHYTFATFSVGMRVRTSLVLAVYRKALVLDSAERRRGRTAGEIVNLISIDAERVQYFFNCAHNVWSSILQIGLALYFLWVQLGVSCLAGVTMMIIMVPVGKALLQWSGRVQREVMKATDARMKVNAEALSNMKVVKLQAWEESFRDRICSLRAEELDTMRTYKLVGALHVMLWNPLPLMVALVTFSTYVLSGNALDMSSALTSLALFDILRIPLLGVSAVIDSLVEATISFGRIRDFLLCDEHRPVGRGKLTEEGVKVEGDASFAYEEKTMAKKTSSELPLTPKPKQERGTLLGRLLGPSTSETAKGKTMTLIESRPAAADAEEGRRKKADSSPPSSSSDEDLVLPTLRRINFSASRGELVAVIGGVGSGKSTLLGALLGEVRPLASSESGPGTAVSVLGTLAYVPQTPFVMNDTLRSNVLFAKDEEPLDEAAYRRAISACALWHDLKLLPDGDLTEIGERGVTLSGGQKARVSLARAAYADADVYLLDDPLSAVDAHVGKHMFRECIVKELLLGGREGEKEKGGGRGRRKRTVVLATNALQYLSSPHVDRIVVMRDGCIAEQGRYAQLRSDETSLFSHYLSVMAETSGGRSSFGESTSSSSSLPLETETEMGEGESRSLEDDDKGKDDTPRGIGGQKKTETSDNASGAGSDGDSRRDDAEKKSSVPRRSSSSAPLMTDELKERETGHVTWDVYNAWARAAGGTKTIIAIVLAFAMTECVNVLSKWWLTYWSRQGSGGGGTDEQLRFLGVYAAINLSAVLVILVRMILIAFTGLAASKEMFNRLLQAVLDAPISFFDTTPIGRILNRFSKDMFIIDEVLVLVIRRYLGTIAAVFGAIVVMTTVTPYFALFLLPLIPFYLHLQSYFTTTYRELKRLDSISRSPLYALLGESLDGVSTIRAYSAQAWLLRRVSAMLDSQQNAYYLTFTAMCWLAVRLELVGTMIIMFACLSVVVEHAARGGDEGFAGLAGLSISFALSVTMYLNASVRAGSDLEANMVAVERVEQYCKIPGEAPRSTPTDYLADASVAHGESWPAKGSIRFRGVEMRYRPGLRLVLKGLDFDVPAGAKVGIVGRTGAGKSTLMVAMLRIVELDAGSIEIDGVDIHELGLKKLREQIAVIPQDPVLFSGSVRTNLDPFFEYSDERLYEVLTHVGLYKQATGSGTPQVESALSSASTMSNIVDDHCGGGGMSTNASSEGVKTISDEVFEGGSNFSVGQRQLLVIARALLCGARIVIMDEATASVDAKTDTRIQRVVRTEFKDATTLTVAHRINTIMDSDYVLVMDDGKAAEFDSPVVLMQRGGLFKDLVDAWEEV